MSNLLKDEEIVEMYWHRNEDAIAESENKYGPLLRSIAFNILSDKQSSEECVNDTYCKVWETIPPQKPLSLSAYMGRIVRNVSINRWHRDHTKKDAAGWKLSFPNCLKPYLMKKARWNL